MVEELASFALSPVSLLITLEVIVSPLVVWMDEDAFELSFGICTFAPTSPLFIPAEDRSVDSFTYEVDPPVKAG